MKKKYILSVLVLLLTLLLLCGCSEEKKTRAQTEPEIKVYWNVDRDAYYDATTKMTMRGKGGDNYRVRFAVDGEQVDLFVPTSTMMDNIDSMKFMGLAVDENNVVTQVYKPHQFTGGVAAYEYYVIEIDGERVLCNNIANGRGLPLKLKINENTGIYDVGGGGLLAGLPCDLQVGDQIYAVMGLDGYVSHIYVMPPFEAKPVYFNVNRQWDSTSKSSTRTREEDGYFTIDFVVDGQPVSLRTNSVDVINQIDSFGAKCMDLIFDENGNITEARHAKYATGGGTVASWYHVLRLDKAGDDINIVADGFYAEKFSGNDKGNTAQCIYSIDCKIYDMSGTGDYMGQPTELRVGDQIHCLSNPDGDVCLIFIISRPRELNLYYNMERKWNSDTKTSTRTKSSDGYYHFEMSVDGKTVNLKTQDPAVVKTIDSRGAKVVGLEVDGNIITAAYAPSSVAGASKTIFDYATVTQIAEDGTITTERNGNTFAGKPVEGCEIYNVSSVAATKGEKTTVRVGDKLYAVGDLFGNIHHIYVVGRTINSPLYWNLDRSYDSATKTTKRIPAEDGYYYIKLSKGTETMTFKTKSKALVNKLDSYVAVALQTNGDVITAVYKYDCAKGYTGGGFASWYLVKSVSGRTVTAGNSKETVSGTMISGCPIYNVSGGSAVPVTKTTLQVGDRIHGVKNSDGNIVAVFVVGRSIDLELYYNLDRQWNSETAATDRVPDEEGWYWFDMSANGQHLKLKTKSQTVANTIDERAARVLGLELKGDEILVAYKPASIKSSNTTVFDYAVVTAVSEDGTILATRKGETYTGILSKTAKVYNVSGSAALVGEFSSVEVGDTIYGLGTGSKNVNYVYITKRTPKLETKTALCSVCNQEVEWKAWDGNGGFDAGHWYLSQNVTVSATATVTGDTTVCLDLCGFEASGKDTLDRIFNLYGTLNLMDSGGTGKVITNYSNEAGRTGSVFYTQNSKTSGYGVLNMYGGTLTSNGNTKQGGIGGVASQFNMYGGTITGGTAIKGGNLYIENTTTAKVTISGGTITGGTADLGADIYARQPVTVSGEAQIGEIYLESGNTVTVDGLTDRASIGVTLADTYGVFATGAVEADQTRFTVAEGLSIAFANGELSIPTPEVPDVPTEHAAHCICGGLGAVGDHTCDETAPSWTAWTGKETEGYYYLTGDVELTATVKVNEGKTLNLCLNGFDIIGGTNVTRLFNLYGTLNLCDHADENGNYAGDVISNYDTSGGNTQTGRVFYVQNKTGAAFNLFGGNLISNSATNKGAIGGTSKVFTMYAGTISGGNAVVCGGNLQIDGGTATIYGGSIAGGKSVDGGNIYVNSGTLQILGGTVSGGEAENAGADVFINTKPTMIVGGAPTVGNVYLTTGKTISVDGLTDGASIGVTLADTYGIFATGAVEADQTRFTVGEGLTMEYTGGNLSIVESGTTEEPEPPVVPTHADHCVCAGLGEKGDHTCDQTVPTWEAWNGTWESGKYYYLTADYDLTETIKLEDGQTLNLCLNGFDIKGASTVTRMFNIYGVLNLCDHADEEGNYAGDVISNYDTAGGNTQTGRVFYVQNRETAALNQFGGNLTSNSSTKNGGIGGVCAAYNLYAGTVTGSTATENGGNLMLEAPNAHVTLYGGTISGGNAKNGGNIHIENGTLTLNGGTISGGNASNAGGSIRVNAKGTLNIVSGQLTGGNAKGNGGNVYSQGAIVMTGGRVCGGTAASSKTGGNLYASSGSLSITDDPEIEGKPEISGGSATYGGNIAVKADGCTISGCTVTGGTATYGPQIYFEKDGGTLTVNGCGAVEVYAKAGTVTGDEDVTVTNP